MSKPVYIHHHNGNLLGDKGACNCYSKTSLISWKQCLKNILRAL